MRKPPDDSRYFQKHWSEKGPYFVILDLHGQELATSRIFRNDAWYAVGCELLQGVADAEQRDAEETADQRDKHLRGFTGILIRPVDEDGYQFVYITISGRTLLTSAKFSSRLKAEKAANAFRRIVRDIVQRADEVAYVPS